MNFTTAAAGFASERADFFMFWLLLKCVYRLWQKTKQIGSGVNKRTLFIQRLFSFQDTHTLKSTVKLLFSPASGRLKHCKQCECCFTGFCQDCPNYFYWLPFDHWWRKQYGPYIPGSVLMSVLFKQPRGRLQILYVHTIFSVSWLLRLLSRKPLQSIESKPIQLQWIEKGSNMFSGSSNMALWEM